MHLEEGHASFAWMANEVAPVPAGLAQVPKLIIAGSLVHDHQPFLFALSVLLVEKVLQVDRHTSNELGRGMPPAPLARHTCTFDANESSKGNTNFQMRENRHVFKA